MPDLYLNIDALPVFLPALRAAQRHALDLYLVTCDFFVAEANVHLIMQEERASSGAWIALNIAPGDICVTDDPALASAAILRGARVLSPSGRSWNGAGGREAATRSIPNSSAFAQSLGTAILASRSHVAPDTPRWRNRARA